MHTVNTSVQEKLWVSGEEPLQDIIAIVKRAELSKRCAVAAKKDTLSTNGLTAELEKCRFGLHSVTYLGHEIGKNGTSPKKANVEAIRLAPRPRTKDEVHSFLDLAEFYSKFVRNFATKTHNLRRS